MTVGAAKAIARQWVLVEGQHMPGFAGAFFHGSATWLPDEAPLPDTSDVDVMVVLDGPEPARKPGKFRFRGVLLEVSWLPADQVRSPEQVLGTSHLAGSLRLPSVILDPTGRLTAVQEAVARDFARRDWVVRRGQGVMARIRAGRGLEPAAPFPDQVTAWLFATGLTTHILLNAGLRNPTVRQRYLAARELLAEHGQSPLYETMLAWLGAAQMCQRRARDHLAALEDAFDAATGVIRSPFFFAADITALARPVAIAGSRELIERGDQREAIFWIVATFARCQQVFAQDAPELVARFEPGFRALLADLGIADFADMRRRHAAVVAALPQLWAVAEQVMDETGDG